MLEAKGLYKSYIKKGEKGQKIAIHAVNGVDITLKAGETYALVGESGSGKSTLSKLLMGLISPTSGSVHLENENLSLMKGRELKQCFAKMQMVMQDGQSSLDPRYSVYESIAEPIRNLLNISRQSEMEMIEELMRQMDLPLLLMKRRAHELSGGQQKRVCIARAISVSPQILIFDEAVSGLDVIIRKNILELLKKLQKEHGYTYLFITHDIDVALYIARNILVMKDGKIIESIQYDGDISCFKHSYSRLLLDSLLGKSGI